MCIFCANDFPQAHEAMQTAYANPTVNTAAYAARASADQWASDDWRDLDQTPINIFEKSTDYEAFMGRLTALNRPLTPEMAHEPITVNLEELNNHPDYREAAEGALQTWSWVTPLTFEFVTEDEYLTVVSPEVGEPSDGSAFSAGRYVSIGQKFHDTEPHKTVPGGYVFDSFIHEFGHEFGLNHPGFYNYGGPGGDQITYLHQATWVYDQRRYSMMSYNDGINLGGETRWTSTTPMMADIEGVIRKYFSTVSEDGQRSYEEIQLNTGDDVYGFGAEKIGYVLTSTGPTRDVGFVIHDTGGYDTMDFSGSTAGTILDMRAGRWSSVNGHEYNVAIYEGHNEVSSDYYIERGLGSRFNDLILGNDGNNELIGNAGDDKIAGFDGNDLINGGAGNDTLDGGNQADRIYGGNGNDSIIGGLDLLASRDRNNTLPTPPDAVESEDGNDRLYGGAGNDTIDGGAGNDLLDGGTGNDVLRGMAGADTFRGGDGIDTVDYSHESPFQLLVNLATNVASGGTASGDQFFSIENLIGSNDRIDRFIGNDAANYFQGLGGGDYFSGGNGNDTLDMGNDADVAFGEGGNDVLIGGRGYDWLDGGTGTDTASYVGSDAGVSVNLATGAASGGHAQGLRNGVMTGDRLVSIENLIGSSHADVLTGDGGGNRLTGDAGNDTLNGGAGADFLTGGRGADQFVFDEGFGRDNVNDFSGSAGQGDVLAFSATLFATVADVLAAATQVGVNTVIAYDETNTVTIRNLQLASLGEADLIIV